MCAGVRNISQMCFQLYLIKWGEGLFVFVFTPDYKKTHRNLQSKIIHLSIVYIIIIF